MKPRILFIIFVLAIITLYYGEAFCQKWGNVSQEELNMTSIPEDPDADAVILFDKGEYLFGYACPVTLKIHKRIKVLTKRGTEAANLSIPLFYGEKIKDLKGHTFTRDGRKIKLKSELVFTKQGKDWDEVVFTMPGAEEGCVFEYIYDKWIEYTYVLGPWYFQNEYFTKLSQVTLTLPSGWEYSYIFMNSGSAKTEPNIEEILTPRGREKEFVWNFENVSAIREEPFVSCIRDYRTAIYFAEVLYEVKKGLFGETREMMDTWKEVGNAVDTLYKSMKHGKKEVKDKALELTDNIAKDSDKAAKIYDYVRQNIEWNGERGILNFEEKYLKNTLARLEGTAVEKNLLLWNLLRGAGIKAYPVLIRTRDNGSLLKDLPSFFQFNHLTIYVNLEGKTSFLDAVDPFCPFGLMPRWDLVEYGLLLSGERSRLIELPTTKKVGKSYFETSGEISEDGRLECNSAITCQGYSGIDYRKAIMQEGREAFAQKKALRFAPGGSLDSIRYNSLDSLDQPLEMSFRMSAPQYAQVIGQDLYVNPTLFTRLESNPFKDQDRRFPLDLTYPFSGIEKTELTIPEGYKVRSLPENVNHKILGAKFRKTFSLDENKITCYRQLTVTQLVFPVKQYPKLQNFYQEIMNADQLLVILTKSVSEAQEQDKN